MSYVYNETSKQNIQQVRDMIQRKVGLIGKQNFYVQEREIKGVQTDVDHVPYTRLYRSDPFTGEAIPWSGDSGYKPRMNSFYTPNIVQTPDPVEDLCFQVPCSTRRPCYPKFLYKGDEMYESLQDRICVGKFV
jgi:hypothetical protein